MRYVRGFGGAGGEGGALGGLKGLGDRQRKTSFLVNVITLGFLTTLISVFAGFGILLGVELGNRFLEQLGG